MKKSILHTLAAYIIYRVSFDFSLFAYSVDLPGSLQRLLAVSLAIACILGLIYLIYKISHELLGTGNKSWKAVA